MSQSPHTASWQNPSRSRLVQIEVHQNSTLKNPSENAVDENGIHEGRSSGTCFTLGARQWHDLLSSAAGMYKTSTKEDSSTWNWSSSVFVSCPVCIPVDLENSFFKIIWTQKSCVKTFPLQGNEFFSMSSHVPHQMFQHSHCLLGRLFSTSWQVSTRVLVLREIWGKKEQMPMQYL